MSKKPTPTVRTRTESEYHTTNKYLQLWQNESEQYPTFADFFADWEISPSTIEKHLRQARILCKRQNLQYNIGRLPNKPIAKPPPKFSDDDFQTLYNAFNDSDFPPACGQRAFS